MYSQMNEEDNISTKLFVGNLSFDTTQQELESLFAEMGELSDVFLPVDRATGRPRGFAFIEFVDTAAAKAAIERFNDYDLGGRNLRVNEAEERPQRQRPSSFSNSGGGGGGGGFSDFGSSSGQPFNPKAGKPKGSRRNLRGKKRSL